MIAVEKFLKPFECLEMSQNVLHHLPLMKNVLKLLVKSVLISLGLIAATSATDAAIQMKIIGSGMTTLII